MLFLHRQPTTRGSPQSHWPKTFRSTRVTKVRERLRNSASLKEARETKGRVTLDYTLLLQRTTGRHKWREVNGSEGQRAVLPRQPTPSLEAVLRRGENVPVHWKYTLRYLGKMGCRADTLLSKGTGGIMSFASCFHLFCKFMILSNILFMADSFLIKVSLRLTI